LATNQTEHQAHPAAAGGGVKGTWAVGLAIAVAVLVALVVSRGQQDPAATAPTHPSVDSPTRGWSEEEQAEVFDHLVGAGFNAAESSCVVDFFADAYPTGFAAVVENDDVLVAAVDAAAEHCHLDVG
jgi:hypothetical protein